MMPLRTTIAPLPPLTDSDHRYQRRCPECHHQSAEDFFDEGLVSLTTRCGVGTRGMLLCRVCGQLVDRFLLVDTRLGQVIAECLATSACGQPDHAPGHPCVRWRDRYLAHLAACARLGIDMTTTAAMALGARAQVAWGVST